MLGMGWLLVTGQNVTLNHFKSGMTLNYHTAFGQWLDRLLASLWADQGSNPNAARGFITIDPPNLGGGSLDLLVWVPFKMS